MYQPEITHQNYNSIITDIKNGQIKIPQFQRDFVWDLKKSTELLDSIIKGYPIGTFIFWRTKEKLKHVRNIGGLKLPDSKRGEYSNLVLDGQQRLTTIFAIIGGLVVTKADGIQIDYSQIFLDLDADETDKIVLFDIENTSNPNYISLTKLLNANFIELGKYNSKYHKKINDYKTRIESYNFAEIIIKNSPIDIATEIFTRINVTGKPLTVFEIMVAKTFDNNKNFDLSEKCKNLMEDLKYCGYETISETTLLQSVSILLKKECSKKAILSIKKEDFINKWDLMVDCLKKSIDYLRNHYRIPVSSLLPYNALLITLIYFFSKNKKNPIGEKQKLLDDFFWRCAIGGRYSSSLESKVAQDILKIDKILGGKQPKYDWTISTKPEFILENGFFSTGRSFIKAILCIFASKKPRSFNTNSDVRIDNSWLKIASSKNYHHFFPKAFLKKKNIDFHLINNIVNITIVDAFLNKAEIRANPPSQYMKKFRKENSHLAQTMKTHLITELLSFGIWNDNFNKFLKKRAIQISKELNKRIIFAKGENELKEQLQDYDESTEI